MIPLMIYVDEVIDRKLGDNKAVLYFQVEVQKR